MPTPTVGQRVRFTDFYNGVRMEGVIVRPGMHSHFDRPSWDVRVDRREGEEVDHGPLLCVTQQEIDEVL